MQASLFRQVEEEYCCLRRFIAEQLLRQGVRPDSISEIALLGRQRRATGHLSALYLLMAKHTTSVYEVNTTGIIRLLGLDAEDAETFRILNQNQRKRHSHDRAKSCECKLAEDPP